MARGQRDPTRERQWRERVAQWQASGLSVREFCRRQGLTEPTFHFWKRELRARDEATGTVSTQRPSSQSTAAHRPAAPSAAVKSPSQNSAASVPKFVPLTVLPSATLSVEVRCPSGHVVCLPECDVASLASLFAALDSLARETPSC